MLPPPPGRRVLIMIWDGLRPDMVSEQTTPTLVDLARRGVWFENSHSCFPTDTRVNAACLATGARPGVHGVVGNELYVPQIKPRGTVSTAERATLERLAKLSGGRALDVPTISEVVQDLGLTAASAASGSEGTALLCNYARDSIIIHPGFCQPAALEEYIYERFGRVAPQAPAEERNRFVVEAFVQHVLPEVEPELAILWLTTPDDAQHRAGLGAPQAMASIRANDEHLKSVLDALETHGLLEKTDIIVGSDHGFSTVAGQVGVEQALADPALGPGAEDIVVSSSGIFLPEGDEELLRAVVARLQSLEGVGAIWTPGGAVQGTLDRRRLFPDHARAPSVVYSAAWDESANDFGVAGTARGAGRARHGTSALRDIRNVLVAWGKSFRKNVRSEVPVGIIDIAPTALWVMGIKPPRSMEGRVIAEALVEGPEPGEVPWEVRREEAVAEVAGRRYLAWAEYACVEGRTYLRQAGARGG